MPLAKTRKIELLGGLALFQRCTKRELNEVARLTVEDTFPAGAVLTREGQAGGLAYVIVEGRVRARRNGRTLGVVGPDSIVGELSLIDGAPRSATVTALDDLHVLTINSDDFTRLLADSPRFSLNLLRTLAARLRETDKKAVLGH